MDFKCDLAIPQNTAKESPISQDLGIVRGKITGIKVFLPWGCAGLAGVSIWYASWQIAPITLNEYLTGNETLHDIDMDYDVLEEPLTLIVKGYNLDDTYEHTPWIRVSMITSEITTKMQQFLQTLGMR